MTRIEQIIEACDHGDEVALERLGWRGVVDALRMWPRRLGGGDLIPYAMALSDRDPEDVVAAIRSLATNEYRPSASQVLVAMAPPAPSGPARGRRRQVRWDLTPAALMAVRLKAAAGAEVCECPVRSPQLWVCSDGVLSCVKCGGLEYGQYETAMESPTLGETPA